MQVKKRRVMSPKQAAACCRPVDDLLDPALFKALCDPTRTRLLGCLVKCGRACSVTEVAECCSVDFSVVSRHLALLARAEILVARREGRVVRYVVRYARLGKLLRELADAIEEHAPTEEPCCAGGRRGSC
ncbi:MAG: helix-turn-helix transcriptional regulator [Planctomycetes bacterium]|nr:helix-turn-helix transcriptional regulator [Planctomycetota bacterium]